MQQNKQQQEKRKDKIRKQQTNNQPLWNIYPSYIIRSNLDYKNNDYYYFNGFRLPVRIDSTDFGRLSTITLQVLLLLRTYKSS